MWPFVSEALKILGLTTPLLYGALIYGFFHYLDKRASGEAKRAISAWLETFRYDAGAVASAMMELFDKIYGIPLLARRAFLRSVLFTVGVTTAFLYESGELRTLVNLAGFTIIGRMAFASFLLINCLADYAALFLIRPMLGIGSDRPIAVLLAGIIAGATIVALNYVFWPSLTYFYMVTGLHPGIPRIDSYSWSELIDFIYRSSTSGLTRTVIAAAFAVHLWIPLLVCSVLLIKVAKYLFEAVRLVQWFIKQGRHHPLDAIGYVAAIVVFAATVTYHLASR
jgi:hypothetical protein